MSKKKSKLTRLIVFLIIMILAAGGFLAYLIISKKQPTEPKPTTEVKVEKTAEEIKAEKLKKTEDDFKALVKEKYGSEDLVKIIHTDDLVTLSFVGDVSLADNWHIAPKYDSRGGISGILGDSMLKLMKDSTLMVANSEFTVSNRGTKMRGKTYTFRAKPERLKIYDEMGVDLVSLANNHVYDFGKDAFLDMLESFEKYKIPHVGAGRNLDEAKKPFFFIINGKSFAFFGATRAEKNILTPGATKTSEGVFRCYDPTEAINLIKELRPLVDYIIPMIHFGRENSHSLENVQIESAKKYIDAGADIIIGHHAHVLQGFEFYKDKLIVYNLGNFLFNNVTLDTALFQIQMSSDNADDKTPTINYYVFPAVQQNEKTSLVDGNKKAQIIRDLNSWSVNTKIDSNGKIEKK